MKMVDNKSVKKEIADKINKIDDPEILQSLETIVNDLLAQSLGEDFWDALPAHVKEGIRQAEKELEQGNGIPHDQVMNDIKKRFKG